MRDEWEVAADSKYKMCIRCREVNKKSKRKRKEKAKMVIAIVSTVFGSAPWTILSQNIRSAYDAAVEPPWSYLQWQLGQSRTTLPRLR